MNKEEANKEVAEQMVFLRAHQENITKLVAALDHVARGSDVAFSTVEETKRILAQLNAPELKRVLEKTFKVVRERAVSRVKEI